MSVVHGLCKGKGDARTHPHHRGSFHAKLFRNHVRTAEPDAPDILRQPVGVLAHDPDGIGAVGPEYPDSTRGAHTMLVQEDHDLPDDLLVRPARCDPGSTNRPDAPDFIQTLRAGFDDVEDIPAEVLHQPPCIDGADTPGSCPSPDISRCLRLSTAPKLSETAPLNCRPCVRSLIHAPVAVIHSPADIAAAWPTAVTRFRCPLAFTRRTQKPFSGLWKVTRSTSPEMTSGGAFPAWGFGFTPTHPEIDRQRSRQRSGEPHPVVMKQGGCARP